MKRKFFVFFILVQLAAAAAFAQLTFQKSTFVAKETNVFHSNQQVALNTKSGQTLVIWHRITSNSSVIQGRLVSPQGNPVGAAFTVISSAGVAHPSLAYNPVRNEFLLAYDNNPNVSLFQSNVFVQRLTPQGKVSGTAIKVTTDTVSSAMANFFPRVAFNAKTNGYGLVWVREIITNSQVNEGNNGLVSVAITPGAFVSGNVSMVQKTVIESQRLWAPTPLDILYQPYSGKFLAVFVQVASGTNASQANYYLGTLDPLFTAAASVAKVNANPLQLNSEFAWGARLSVFADRPALLFYSDTNNIKRRKIGIDGKLSGTSVVAFKAPKNNTRLLYPSATFVTNSLGTRGVLIASQDVFKSTGNASTWAQVLDANGLPLGVPVRVDLTDATNTVLSGVVSALPAKITDTLFRFTWYTTLAQFKAPGQTYENSGLVKVNLNLKLP